MEVEYNLWKVIRNNKLLIYSNYKNYKKLEIMRLNEKYRTTIKQVLLKYFGQESEFYLFGSRVDDSKKGGDIDLYIETNIKGKELYSLRRSALVEMKNILGDQKIDLVIYIKGEEPDPIHIIAKDTGVRL